MNLTMNDAWLLTVRAVLADGQHVVPRGKSTIEILHHTTHVDMRYPVLTHPDRALSYQFMAAEALWILSGDDTVAGIAPYNKHIAQFSDDGIKFFGAYGPKIKEQLAYVVSTLKRDPESRQAGITIWRENPPITKDVPCTITIFASLRNTMLNLHVFMRSSDVWLGLPYDVFNFSMLGHLLCCHFNEGKNFSHEIAITPGTLFLTAMSTHLYDTNLEQVSALNLPYVYDSIWTPCDLYLSDVSLFHLLHALRTSHKGDPLRWWEFSKEVVHEPSDI